MAQQSCLRCHWEEEMQQKLSKFVTRLMCTNEHSHHVTAMAVNFRYPSTTALWTATRSAHTVKPKEAFSTLQPGNTQSIINNYFK